MIHVNNLSFSRGQRCILNAISCELHAASCTMLLGPNGAGKTTLLDLVAGFLPAAHGDIRYDETPISQLTSKSLAQTRAVVSQRSELSFPFPVRDVVLFGRNPFNHGHPSDYDQHIVETCLAWVDAEHLIDKNYLRLSGGEQQMVHVARALAQIWQEHDNYWQKHLFLDEALSNLDLQHQATLGKLIRNLCDKGCCIVMVIHDLNLATRIGDRFLLLADQQIQAQGGHELFERIELFERVYACQLEATNPQFPTLFPSV